MLKLLEALIALERIISILIEAFERRQNAKDSEELKAAVEAARRARTREERIEAAKRLRDAAGSG